MSRHRREARGVTRPRAFLVLAVPAFVMALLAGPASLPALADTGTYVRLVQLSPDMNSVAMTITSAADPSREVMLPATPYGGVSDYRRLEPGDYVVAVRQSGSAGPPAITTALKAAAGASYTLASVGDPASGGLRVIVDDLTPPPAGRAALRIIDASPTDPALDVLGRGDLVLRGLTAGAVSPYRTVDPGRVVLSVGPPGGAASALTVPVRSNQILSVVLLRKGGRLQAEAHVDASGPATAPPGAVDAGYGGTALPHGPLPAALLGVLAVGAAGLSALRARRTGGSAGREPTRTC